MRSGSMTPEFSSTIFFWRWKKGTSVGQCRRETSGPSRLSRISAASAAATRLYNRSFPVDTPVETSGPSEHSPMHPTPFAWQCSPHPRRAMSLSRASLTAWPWQETQPAARQTFTRCLKRCCESRSVSAICSSSSGVMAHPLRQVFPQGLRTHFARDFLVIHHGGSKSARTKTARGQERNFSVRRCLARQHAEVPLHGVEQQRSAFDVAGRPGADHASVLARRFEREEVIERGDAKGAAEGYSQRCRHVSQRLFVKIAERFLHGVQGLNQPSGLQPMAAHGGIHQTPAFVLIGRHGLGESEHRSLLSYRLP